MAKTPSALATMFKHLQDHIAIAKEKKPKLDIRNRFARDDHASGSTSSSPLTIQPDLGCSHAVKLGKSVEAFSDESARNDHDECSEESSDEPAQGNDDANHTHTSTGKSLTEFSKFPELPFEIRRLIYSHAAVTEYTRFLPVELTLREADEEIGLYFTFTICPKQMELPVYFLDGDEFDIGMLSACTESRQVYLGHHNCILPAGFKSVIRYNPDRTIIHIQNFEDLQLNDDFFDAVRDGWKTQKWFREIKQLSVPVFSFLTESGVFEPLWGDHGYGHMMAVFENLETWRALVHPGDWIVGRERVQKQHMELMAAIVQGGLHVYKRDINPDYKIPKVSIFEIVPPEIPESIEERGKAEEHDELSGSDGLDEDYWVDEDDE
ncbi:uncharacterized protein RSE6_09533 [Rhynchosporium secalis]|uniref:2EXR domain-containing protein n=1 Tax=Rhynchosporium secalis TaxID=38038 RepID=A0A1E1MI45_RHYSE|nr:uncharacterized protein RSE6_09533 [Rhynchosporium secalis]